ncbi:MAG: patatin-like phospholipase family protein [Spirochaetales bacterium]
MAGSRVISTMFRNRKPRIGLALSAGGAKGVAFIPFLAALEEMGLRPSVVAGSSAGALFGGLYAAGMSPSKIIETLESLGPLPQLQAYDPQLRGGSLFKGNKAHELIRRILPVSTFEETRIPFRAVAVDFWQREEVLLKEGNLADAIRASVSIPGLFSPFVMDNRVLIDGGIINALPYDRIQHECDFVIALHLSEDDQPEHPTDLPPFSQMIVGTVRIMRDRIIAVKKQYNPPDYYKRIGLARVGLLDFRRWRETVDAARDEAVDFAAELPETLRKAGIRITD